MAVMLAMDMGTGKSKVAVDLAVHLGVQRILILCPKSVIGVWGREFARHAGREVLVWPAGTEVKRFERLSVAERVHAATQAIVRAKAKGVPFAIVCNYDAVWRAPFDAFVLSAGFEMLIFDESHRIKAPGGRASLFCARLGSKVPLKIALTGTPMPHSPLDIYAQYRALDPGVFGNSYTLFSARYAVKGGYLNKQVIGFQRQDELNQRFYKIAMRVMAEDVQKDLPPMLFEERRCTLSPRARRAYVQLREFMVAEINNERLTVNNALTKLLRLQQLTSGFARLDSADEGLHLAQIDTAKRDLLKDVLEDIPLSESVVVFARFHHDLREIEKVAQELGRTYGEVSGPRKDLTSDATMPQAINLMGVQISAGGVGIDLTQARYAIYYSVGFNLGDYLQSIKRVHRPGQTRNTYFIHLVAEDTVDETVFATLSKRQDIVEAVLADLTGEEETGIMGGEVKADG